MQEVTVNQMMRTLDTIVEQRVPLTVMLWGAPGIGKSRGVHEVARRHQLTLEDVRISQLAPTDLRGVPYVTEREFEVQLAGRVEALRERVTAFAAPDFLPRTGGAVLFLDELNQAPPAMVAITQQLLLDRRVGNYRVPDGVFIWAAGNRKEDRAAVFDLSAPVANRMVHYSVRADVDEWLRYGAARLDERVVAYVGYRPANLHRYDPRSPSPAWPSPRSWEMASRLLQAGLSVRAAVGEAAGSEFEAFCEVYARLPDAQEILEGRASFVFQGSEKLDEAWAITTALATRAQTGAHVANALLWIGRQHPEWFQLMTSLSIARLRELGRAQELAEAAKLNPDFRKALIEHASVLSLANGAPREGRD